MKRSVSRLAGAATAVVALGLLAPPTSSAEVRSCVGGGTVGTWTCKTTRGGVIDNGIPGLIELSGSGRNASAQIRGGSTLTASAPGSLTLTYYPSDITLVDAQITVELKSRQPGCTRGMRPAIVSCSRWTWTALQELVVPSPLLGPASYTITVRATTSSQGHFTATVAPSRPHLA
jgi:hypothetical protein